VRYDVHFVFFPRFKRLIANQLPPMKLESARSTIWYGQWHRLARPGWLIIAALTVGLFIVGLPIEYGQLQHGCLTPCASTGGVAPVEASLLEKLGLSLNFFATYGVVLEVIFASVFVTVAALIFWRKSSDGVALFISLALLLFGTATEPSAQAAVTIIQPDWRIPVNLLHFIG
jgi:hypothetical protein